MVDLKNKHCESNGCTTRSNFGLPGKQASHCAEHREKGMIFNPSKQCLEVNCRQLALYGILKQEHCEQHKYENEINLIERQCKTCPFLGILDKDGNCETCDPASFKKVRLAKQTAVVDYLKANGIEMKQIDRIIDGGVCGLERPDIYIDCGTHILIVEVDEDQHSGRPCECEQTRMVNISQSNGLKTFFLRFNPDGYKRPKGIKQESTAKRFKTLLDWVNHWKKTEPIDFLSVMYLYFDGYQHGFEKVECIISMEADLKVIELGERVQQLSLIM